MGLVNFQWNFYFIMGKLISYRISKFPMTIFNIPMEFRIFQFEIDSPRQFKMSQGISKYAMGKPIFPLQNLISHGNLHLWSELSHLQDVNRYKTRRCLTMLNMIYNMIVTVFLCFGLRAGAFLPKSFWQNEIGLI